MSKPLVAVHGSYFANNFGDTLLVQLMCDQVARHIGRDNVFLAVDGHGIEQKLIGYPVIPKHLRPRVTHLIFAGGGYLGEPKGGLLNNLRWSARAYLRHLKWLSSFKNADFAFFGLGFGPLSNSLLRKKVRGVLSRAKWLLVRDNESFNWLNSYEIPVSNASVCVDFALSIKPTSLCQRKGVALHIDNLSIEEIKVVMRSVFASLTCIIEEPLMVIFDNPESGSEKNKQKYTRALKEIGINKTIDFRSYQNPSNLLSQLESFRLTITSKLHVGITTIALGGTAISVPAHQKTIRLYKQLDLADFCIDRTRLTEAALSKALKNVSVFSPQKDVIDSGVDHIQTSVANFLFSVSSKS